MGQAKYTCDMPLSYCKGVRAQCFKLVPAIKSVIVVKNISKFSATPPPPPPNFMHTNIDIHQTPLRNFHELSTLPPFLHPRIITWYNSNTEYYMYCNHLEPQLTIHHSHPSNTTAYLWLISLQAHTNCNLSTYQRIK